ncbi:MAG: glycosyltransferase family 4 protein [Chloroflexi bacterium]|nr:glycosyltransferase family 4 protein [Chloroflexota bacterium]
MLFPTDSRTVHGIETSLLDLIAELKRNDIEAIALVSDTGAFAQRLRALGVSTIYQPSYVGAQAVEGLYKAVRTQRIDVVHLFYSSALVTASLAARAAHRPLIYHFGNFPPPLRRTWVPRLLRFREFRLGMVAATRAVAVSKAVRDAWLRERIGRRKRFSVIPSGLDTDRFLPSARVLGTRSALGIPADAEVIGFAGQLVDYKGMQEFFQAGARLVRTRPNLYLLVVGGLGASDYYEAELLGAARRLNIEKRVILTGYQSDMPRYLVEMDILLVPSWHEAFGMVVVEGMATGVPVIGSTTGSIPEIIRDGVDGLLVRPRDVAALAAAAGDLLDNPERRARLSRAGAAQAREVFTVEVTAARRRVV